MQLKTDQDIRDQLFEIYDGNFWPCVIEKISIVNITEKFSLNFGLLREILILTGFDINEKKILQIENTYNFTVIPISTSSGISIKVICF